MDDKDRGLTRKKATIIVHSYALDKLYSALIIGNGALATGMEVTLFFTFFGLRALTRNGLKKPPLSKMNFFGLGRILMGFLMRRKNVASLKKLFSDFKELGGKVVACEMTMEIMGIRKEDLRSELIDDYGAVGTYIAEAKNSSVNLIV
jgi:peroxiredoxin family protein